MTAVSVSMATDEEYSDKPNSPGCANACARAGARPAAVDEALTPLIEYPDNHPESGEPTRGKR